MPLTKLKLVSLPVPDQIENAELLIGSVARALARGIRHFNEAGQELTDVKSVLICLLAEGTVTLESKH